jgi:serine/threonine protein kinase
MVSSSSSESSSVESLNFGELHNINIRNYTLINELGKGSFSVVWLAHNNINNNMYAIKIHDSDSFIDAFNEIKFVKKLPDSPQINNLIEYFIETSIGDITDKPLLCSIWNLHACNLDYYIQSITNGKGLTLPLCISVVSQVLKGLILLHTNINAFHGDIKPDNILIKGISKKTKVLIDSYRHNKPAEYLLDDEIYDNDFEVCLSDFGSYCHISDSSNYSLGTIYYHAPEVILKGPCLYPIDIWALGCSIYEMLTGKILFDISSKRHHLSLIQNICGEYPDIIKKYDLYSKYFNNNKLKYTYLSNMISVSYTHLTLPTT